MHQSEFQILAGIDLGRWLHVASVIDATYGSFLGEMGFPHSREGLTEVVEWLKGLVQNKAHHIGVAIEKPHGAVVDTLLGCGMAVFSINPKQVDRFRDRHSVSGAKDDRRDAFVLADALRTDVHRFQRLKLPPPELIAMRELLSSRNQLIKQHIALSSQIRELLVRCWPHLLRLAPTNRPLDAFFCELIELFLQQHDDALPPHTVRDIIRKHRIRRVKLEDVLATLQKAPLYVADGTLPAISAHLKLLVRQLLLVRHQRRELDQHLERWFEQIRLPTSPFCDAAILASLPGVGAVVLATLLSHAHDAIRLRNLDAFRSLGGVAPVTKQSGKRRQVIMRRARSLPLNDALHHWAAIAVQRDPHFKLHYHRLRKKGHHHARALRGVMDRILLVAVAMLRHRSFYDPARRINSPRQGNT